MPSAKDIRTCFFFFGLFLPILQARGEKLVFVVSAEPVVRGWTAAKIKLLCVDRVEDRHGG